MVDCASDLPAGAVVCQRKQHDEDTSIECLSQAMDTTEIDTLLGDAWYDTLNLHEFCADRETLPICTFNPRNSDENYDYRIEKLVENGEIDEELIDGVELGETFRQRKLRNVSSASSKTMTANWNSPSTAPNGSQRKCTSF